MSEDKKSPRHVVLMLDGNRRWARKRGWPSFRGHYQGAKTLQSLIESLSQPLEPKIEFVSFWGGSVSNLTNRPDKEVRSLFDVYGKYFAMLAKRKELKERGIRIRIVGGWGKIVPQKVRNIFEEIIRKTQNNTKLNLTFLIAYDGKEEMLEAVKKISSLKPQASKISENLLKQNLWTGDLPPVDLVIRTGVENDPHWSAGFMMWLCAESQFYFTKTLWPDFSVKEFQKAIKAFQKTQRRFGK